MILAKLIAGKPAPGSVAEVAGIAVAKPTEQHPADSGSVAKIAGIAVATPVSSGREQSAPSSEAELATAIVAIPATQTPSEAPKDRAGLLAALAAAREGLPLSLDQLVQAFGAEGEADWLEGYEPHCRPEFLRAFAETVAARLAREQAAEPEPESSLVERLDAFADALSKPLPRTTWSQDMHERVLNTPVIIIERRANALVATVGNRTWHGYSLPPIDAGWGAAPTVETWLRDEDVANPEPPLPEEEIDCIHQGELMVRRSLWHQAQAVAARLGWEGDFREPPRVFTLPNPDRWALLDGFLLKQDSNGTTYVVAPVALAWLEHDHEQA